MAVDSITEAAVQGALWSLRYGQPLSNGALLALDQVTLRLEGEGLDDSTTVREWLLGQLLAETVADGSRRTRERVSADPVRGGSNAASGADALTRLRHDFRAGDADLEAWSMLAIRYLSASQPPTSALANALSVSGRTLERRLARGHRLLAAALREREVAATQALSAHAPPPRDRIAVRSDADALPVPDIFAALRATIRDDRSTLRLSTSDVAALTRHVPRTLDEYYLGRVAAWSQPRYRLDERFVGLSLLVDMGEEAQDRRWQPREASFDSLAALDAAVPESAYVLLGPPGSGKSTLLRRFELDTAIDALRGATRAVPFLVPLNHYRSAWPGDPPPAPRDWLSGLWRKRGPTLPPLDELLDAGRVVLLLDGLNEMPHQDQADFHRLVLAIKQLLHDVLLPQPANRVVLSCRSLDYSSPLSSATLRVPQVRLEPMSDDQVRTFLDRYAPDRSARLWAGLSGTAHLSLYRTPYFLRLLVEQWPGEVVVPAGHAGLFTGFVRSALRREVERDHPLFAPGALLTERDRRRLVQSRPWRDASELPEHGPLIGGLAGLALQMQERAAASAGAQVRVPYDVAVSIVGEAGGDPVLRAGMALGILDEDLLDGTVLFFHQLLQEYFAARRLAPRPIDARLRAPWRMDEVTPALDDVLAALAPDEPLPSAPTTGWEETALLALCLAPQPDERVLEMAEFNLPLAGRAALRDEVRLGESTRERLRWALVRRSRDPHADLRARLAAADVLGHLGDPRFVRRSGAFGDYLHPPMVELAGGRILVGRDDGPADERPVHRVDVAAFALGQFPVTNAEWACFLDAGGYDEPRWWPTPGAEAWRSGSGTAEGSRWDYRLWRQRLLANPALLDEMRDQGRVPTESYEAWRARLTMDGAAFERHLTERWPDGRRTEPAAWRREAFRHPLQPVVGVSWYEAWAFCHWLSAQTGRPFRLPTEVEWEAAARGADGRPHAFGADFAVGAANTVEVHLFRPSPVGVFPAGDSPQGVADLHGNVFEWSASHLGPIDGSHVYGYPYDARDGRESPDPSPTMKLVVRGGAWSGDVTMASSTCRSLGAPLLPDYRGTNLGFRVACSGTPGGGPALTG